MGLETGVDASRGKRRAQKRWINVEERGEMCKDLRRGEASITFLDLDNIRVSLYYSPPDRAFIHTFAPLFFLSSLS